MIEQKCVASITLADVDARSELKLIDFVNLPNKVFDILEEQHKLQKSHTVVANKLVHLTFLWTDFLILIVIFNLNVGGSLEGLAYISY